MKRRIKLIKEWFMMTFTKHKIGYCGAVILETKEGGICAECGKLIPEKDYEKD